MEPFPVPGPPRGGNEPDHLATAADRSGHRLALLDDQPIRLPAQTPFEARDLISDDRRLIFAKPKGRSSTFGHLCTQAEVAAEMFLRHGERSEAGVPPGSRAGAGDQIKSRCPTARAGRARAP